MWALCLLVGNGGECRIYLLVRNGSEACPICRLEMMHVFLLSKNGWLYLGKVGQYRGMKSMLYCLAPSCCRANVARIVQSSSDSGLVFQVKVLNPF